MGAKRPGGKTSRGVMSWGQNVQGQNILVAKRPEGKTSRGRNILVAKRPVQGLNVPLPRVTVSYSTVQYYTASWVG